MSDESNADLGPGPASIRTFMLRAIDLIGEELRGRAAKDGGKIGADEIGRTIERFRRERSPAMDTLCRTAWTECGIVFDQEQRGEDRKAPFERLMVWPIEHLLPQGGETDGAPGNLSRRIIPGYLNVIETLIGPMDFGRYQERCRELVRIVRAASGRSFRWDQVYADPGAAHIIDDVLVHIAREFEDFDHRRDAFIKTVNAGIGAPRNGSGHKTGFGPFEFALVMNALYTRLERQMANGGERAQLRERHGEAALEHLATLLEGLGEL